MVKFRKEENTVTFVLDYFSRQSDPLVIPKRIAAVPNMYSYCTGQCTNTAYIVGLTSDLISDFDFAGEKLEGSFNNLHYNFESLKCSPA